MASIKKQSQSDHLRLHQFHNALICHGSMPCLDYMNVWTPRPFCAAGNIIKQMEDINSEIPHEPKTNYSGYTLLHFTAAEGEIKYVNTLLNLGADFTKKNLEGNTALHLVNENLHPPSGISMLDHMFKSSWTTANILLNAHIKYENTSNPKCTNGISHFHIACLTNNTKAVEFFLNAGVSVDQIVVTEDSSCKFRGFSPLHFAIRYLCRETVEILLKHKANIYLKDAKGRNFFHILIENNMDYIDDILKKNNNPSNRIVNDIKIGQSLIALFVKNEKLNLLDMEGFGLHVLHIAATLKNKSITEELLNYNIDLNIPVEGNSQLWQGYTALHFAAHFNVEIAELLLKKGANILAKDSKGVTPLDLLIERYPPKVLHRILSTQDCFKNIILSDGYTKLLDVLLAMASSDAFNTFLKCVADVDVVVPCESPLWPSFSLLHIVISVCEKSESIDSMFNVNNSNLGLEFHDYSEEEEKDIYMKRVLICLKQNCNVNKKDANNFTPIHLAFYLKKNRIASLLLDSTEKNNLENPVDPSNLSHFHIACIIGNITIVEYFLRSGIDINCPTKKICKSQIIDDKILNVTTSVGIGWTPLHFAVHFHHIEIVKLLLKSGSNPHAKDIYNLTPVHLAFCSIEITEVLFDFLLSSKNLKNCVTDGNFTYLHVACTMNKTNIIEELIQQGADINAQVIDREFKENYNHTYFLISKGYTPLRVALNWETYQVIDLIIRKGANFNLTDSRGKSPLHQALESIFNEEQEVDISTPFIKVLKQKDCTEHRIDESGLTLLHIACNKLDKEWVEDLLKKGADVNAQINIGEEIIWSGCTPLHVLIKAVGNENTVHDNFLLIFYLLMKNGVDLFLRDGSDCTPVLQAFSIFQSGRGSMVPIFKFFLTIQSNYAINPAGEDGLSHFHLACMVCDKAVVEKFLKQGINVNESIPCCKSDASIFRGFTPLHFAMWNQKSEVVNILLNHGANVRAENHHGEFPLHIAAKRGRICTEDLEQMIRMGVDINARNIWGETPLELLFKSKESDSKLVKIFLEHGSLINTISPVSSEGLMAIALSSAQPTNLSPVLKPIFQVLLEAIKPWDLDENGFNIIHNSVSINFKYVNGKKILAEEYADVIERFLEIGCDLNHQDNQGRIPLHVAIQFNNFEAILALLLVGVDINITDNSNRTPLAYLSDDDDDQEREKILETFAMHIWKMNSMSLYISQVNIDLVRGRFKPDNEIICRCDEELKKMKKVKLNSTCTLRNFLSEIGAVANYPHMPMAQRLEVDLFFKRNINLRKDFPIFSPLLMLQYRKAFIRVQLLQPAKKILFSCLCEVNIQVPDLCLQTVLTFFKNDELLFLISSSDAN